MSTKIYHAVKINSTSTKEIAKVSESLRVFVEEHAKFAFRKLYTDLVHEYTDKTILGLPCVNYQTQEPVDIKYGALTAAFSCVASRWQEMKRTQIRDPEIDVDGEVSFYFLPEYTLAIINSEHAKEHHEFLLSLDSSIVDYGYWNNTDEPDDVSSNEWEKRREDWNDALELKPFNIEILGKYGAPMIKYDELYIREKEEFLSRCEHYTTELLWKEKEYHKKLQEELEKTGKKDSVWDMIKVTQRLQKEIKKTPDFAKKLEEVKAKIKQNYTKDEITNGYVAGTTK